MASTPPLKFFRWPAPVNPEITRKLQKEAPIGPFVNGKPRLLPGQRFEMGMNIYFTEEPVKIALSVSDPSIATVPEFVEGVPSVPYIPYTTMFPIVAHKVGSAILTGRLGEFTVTTPVTVVEDHVTIENLVGPSPQTQSGGQFEYWMGSVDCELHINMTGVVIGETVVTLTSSTPEVATVPDHVVIEDGNNWGANIPVELHNRVGTTLITATCRGVTVKTMIGVVPAPLWIADIERGKIHVKKGERVEVKVTMSEVTNYDIAITVEGTEIFEGPSALIIPKGERTGSFFFHVLEDPGDGSGQRIPAIRWNNALYLLGFFS